MEATGQLHSTVFLPPGKQRRGPLMGGYMDPPVHVYTFWRREKQLFPLVFEPLFIHPVASQCTKWAVRFLVVSFIHSFEVETRPFKKVRNMSCFLVQSQLYILSPGIMFILPCFPFNFAPNFTQSIYKHVPKCIAAGIARAVYLSVVCPTV